MPYGNDVVNAKWFVLGAALTANRMYWTGVGNSGKTINAEPSANGAIMRLALSPTDTPTDKVVRTDG